MKLHDVIYIPGLGDPRGSEKNLVKLWEVYGIKVHYYPMYWNDERQFNIKLRDLINLINDLRSKDHIVSLVGVSAGASAALNAFARTKENISAVVCICGKINNPNTISPKTFERNPSFKESLNLLPDSLKSLNDLDKSRIGSFHPVHDYTVPVKDTFIEGASNKLFISLGHAFSIFLADTLYSYLVVRFVKKKNSNN